MSNLGGLTNTFTILIWIIQSLGVVVVSPYQRAISGRHYVYKLLKSIHSCELELILVVSEGLESCPYYLQTFGVAFMSTREFFDNSQTVGNYRSPRCIAILPHYANGSSTYFHHIVNKLDVEFGIEIPQNERVRVHKPTIMMFYPNFLDRQNGTEQRIVMETVFNSTSNFKINSNVYTIFASGRDTALRTSIWEAYSIKTISFFRRLPFPITLLPEVRRIGWTEGEEFKFIHYYDELDNKIGRRSNFMGSTFIASSKDENTGWVKTKQVGKKVQLVGGNSAFWFWDLSRMLNFSLEVIFGGNIVTLQNTSVAGKTLEQLNSGKADLALMTALVVDFRARSLTFLQPIYSTLIHVFFCQPSTNSIRNIVTAPFHSGLWATIISTWFLIIFIVKLGQWLQIRHHHEQKFKDAEFSAFIGLWAIAANCQKSWYAVPVSVSLKMIFICGSLCGVLVYGAYSAAIVSTLSVHSIPVESFADLISHRFEFTVHNKSEPFQLILKHLIKLWGLHQEVLRVNTEAEISHLLVPENPRAFLSYQDLFYQTAVSLGYTERFVCNTLSKVPISDFRYKTAMFLRKGSEFAEIFNYKTLMIIERGFNFRYVKHYEQGNIFSCNVGRNQRRSYMEPIKFRDTVTAFLVILMGHILSLVLLILEIWRLK